MRILVSASTAAFGVALLAPMVQRPAVAATPLLGHSFGTIYTQTNNVVRNATLYDIDPTTGAQTNPRDVGISGLTGITFGPGGVLYGLTSLAQSAPAPAFVNSLVRINPVTGAATVIGPTGLNVGEGDIEYNPTNGLLYGVYVIGGNPALFTLNPTTGHATVIGGDRGPLSDLSALAFSPAGTLYVLDRRQAAEQDIVWQMDPATGDVITFAGLNVNIGPYAGMDYDPATGILYVADGGGVGGQFGDNALYTLNPVTGQMTLVGDVGPFTTFDEGLAGLTFVPEPAGLTLLEAGALLALRRTRPRSA